MYGLPNVLSNITSMRLWTNYASLNGPLQDNSMRFNNPGLLSVFIDSGNTGLKVYKYVLYNFDSSRDIGQMNSAKKFNNVRFLACQISSAMLMA